MRKKCSNVRTSELAPVVRSDHVIWLLTEIENFKQLALKVIAVAKKGVRLREIPTINSGLTSKLLILWKSGPL